jgi:hypothetical protein
VTKGGLAVVVGVGAAGPMPRESGTAPNPLSSNFIDRAGFRDRKRGNHPVATWGRWPRSLPCGHCTRPTRPPARIPPPAWSASAAAPPRAVVLVVGGSGVLRRPDLRLQARLAGTQPRSRRGHRAGEHDAQREPVDPERRSVVQDRLEPLPLVFWRPGPPVPPPRPCTPRPSGPAWWGAPCRRTIHGGRGRHDPTGTSSSFG